MVQPLQIPTEFLKSISVRCPIVLFQKNKPVILLRRHRRYNRYKWRKPRSGTTTVTVGYIAALKLYLDIPETAAADSFKTVKVTTANMNDVFEKTNFTLTIHKLTAPSRTFRKRYWDQPDQFIMSREEYYKYFPYDLYADENDKSKWPREKKVFESQLISGKDSAHTIKGTPLQPGWYVVEAFTKDRFNETVKDTRYIKIEKTNPEVPVQGQEVLKRIKIKNNRVEINNAVVDSIFIKKQLKIDYITFRDKTVPGTKETWKVKISGGGGEKLSAELLTSMYDASLDEFTPHYWRVPYLGYSQNVNDSWSGQTNFNSIQALVKNYDSYERAPNKQYDRLANFQIEYGNPLLALSGRVPGVAISRGKCHTTQVWKGKDFQPATYLQ